MIGLCNGQTSQKIGIDHMAGMRLGEVGRTGPAKLDSDISDKAAL
jgi:hypothetical protein